MTKVAKQPVNDHEDTLQHAIDALHAAEQARSEQQLALDALGNTIQKLNDEIKAALATEEGEIAEAAAGGTLAHAANTTKKITDLRSRLDFVTKAHSKAKADLEECFASVKRAADCVDHAKKPFIHDESARIAKAIDALEADSSKLRSRLHALAKINPNGLDQLSLRGRQMVLGWAPPPGAEIRHNTPLWHSMTEWLARYREWSEKLSKNPLVELPK
jgi:hypothetical protein